MSLHNGGFGWFSQRQPVREVSGLIEFPGFPWIFDVGPFAQNGGLCDEVFLGVVGANRGDDATCKDCGSGAHQEGACSHKIPHEYFYDGASVFALRFLANVAPRLQSAVPWASSAGES